MGDSGINEQKENEILGISSHQNLFFKENNLVAGSIGYEVGGMEITCMEVMENPIGVEADVDELGAIPNDGVVRMEETPSGVHGRAQGNNPHGESVRTWKRKAREIKKNEATPRQEIS